MTLTCLIYLPYTFSETADGQSSSAMETLCRHLLKQRLEEPEYDIVSYILYDIVIYCMI